jgi:hypothetical protein
VPESSQHLKLVNLILQYFETRWTSTDGFVVLSDYSNRIGDENKPPRIGGYSPDVFGVDVPITMMAIGEAKTADDLTRLHSREQLAAYLEHLRYQPKGVLVLAVPCFFAASARTVVETAKRSIGLAAEEIEVVVLELFET